MSESGDAGQRRWRPFKPRKRSIRAREVKVFTWRASRFPPCNVSFPPLSLSPPRRSFLSVEGVEHPGVVCWEGLTFPSQSILSLFLLPPSFHHPFLLLIHCSRSPLSGRYPTLSRRVYSPSSLHRGGGLGYQSGGFGGGAPPPPPSGGGGGYPGGGSDIGYKRGPEGYADRDGGDKRPRY